jgi:ribosomal protein S18 acetylase RimI-like enzyme
MELTFSKAIRPMQLDDLEQVVEVHLQSFPGFFLTFLGHDFLTLLYDQLCREGVVLVACPHGHIDGFVAGVLQQAGFYRRLVERQKWAFARAAAAAVVRRPPIGPRLLRALRRPTEAQQSAAKACLMSVAVRPEASGRGLGQQLVRAFCG